MDNGNATQKTPPDWLVPLVKSLEAFYNEKRPGTLEKLGFLYNPGYAVLDVVRYNAALNFNGNGELSTFLKEKHPVVAEDELMAYAATQVPGSGQKLQKLLVMCGFAPMASFGEISERDRAKKLLELVSFTPLPQDRWLEELFDRHSTTLAQYGISHEFVQKQAETNEDLKEELGYSFELYPDYVVAQKERERTMRERELELAEREENKIGGIAIKRANAQLKKMLANQKIKNSEASRILDKLIEKEFALIKTHGVALDGEVVRQWQENMKKKLWEKAESLSSGKKRGEQIPEYWELIPGLQDELEEIRKLEDDIEAAASKIPVKSKKRQKHNADASGGETAARKAGRPRKSGWNSLSKDAVEKVEADRLKKQAERKKLHAEKARLAAKNAQQKKADAAKKSELEKQAQINRAWARSTQNKNAKNSQIAAAWHIRSREEKASERRTPKQIDRLWRDYELQQMRAAAARKNADVPVKKAENQAILEFEKSGEKQKRANRAASRERLEQLLHLRKLVEYSRLKAIANSARQEIKNSAAARNQHEFAVEKISKRRASIPKRKLSATADVDKRRTLLEFAPVWLAAYDSFLHSRWQKFEVEFAQFNAKSRQAHPQRAQNSAAVPLPYCAGAPLSYRIYAQNELGALLRPELLSALSDYYLSSRPDSTSIPLGEFQPDEFLPFTGEKGRKNFIASYSERLGNISHGGLVNIYQKESSLQASVVVNLLVLCGLYRPDMSEHGVAEKRQALISIAKEWANEGRQIGTVRDFCHAEDERCSSLGISEGFVYSSIRLDKSVEAAFLSVGYLPGSKPEIPTRAKEASTSIKAECVRFIQRQDAGRCNSMREFVMTYSSPLSAASISNKTFYALLDKFPDLKEYFSTSGIAGVFSRAIKGNTGEKSHSALIFSSKDAFANFNIFSERDLVLYLSLLAPKGSIKQVDSMCHEQGCPGISTLGFYSIWAEKLAIFKKSQPLRHIQLPNPLRPSANPARKGSL